MNGIGSIVSRIVAAAAVASAPRYHAELVQTGRDLNGSYRSAEMLAASAPLFEGRPCKVLAKVGADGKPIEDHQASADVNGREASNVVGHFERVRYDDAAFGGTGGLVGDLVVAVGCEDGDALERRLAALSASGGLKAGALGLSFNGFGRKDAHGVETIEAVDSVDVVTFPAAGGRVAHKLAASRSVPPMLAKLIAALQAKCAALVDGLPSTLSTEYALGKHLAASVKAKPELRKLVASAFGIDEANLGTEAADVLDAIMGGLDALRASIPAETPAPAATPPAPTATPPAPAAAGDASAAVARGEAAARSLEVRASVANLAAACDEAKLPPYAKQRVLASHAGAVLTFDQAKAVATAKAAEIDEVLRASVGARAVVTMDSQERLTASLACMFSRRAKKPEGLDPIRDHGGSLNTFLERHFGVDVRRAKLGASARRELRAAVDATNLDAVFDDGINRALLAEYRGDEAVTMPWRSIVNVTSESDFRTKEVIAPTYYDEMADVDEGAAYPLLTTPTDRKETYAITKRGGVETITWEKMLNDDLGIWQVMLRRMATAFRETLNERVFQKIRRATQPTMADGYKLTSASRSPVNEGALALSGDATGWDNFMTAVIGMMSATGGGGKKKGIKPAFLVIPLAKAKVAGSLFSEFSAAATDVPTRRGLEVLRASLPNVVVDVGTADANDWFLIADPADAEVLRVAFLGGREEPEVYVANNESFGSMFTNDRIEVKGRHAYAVAAVDYAGIYGEAASA